MKTPNPVPIPGDAPPTRSVVASYLATFLKPEMLHVYRQLRAMERWRPVVICQKRENEKTFQLQDIRIVPKPLTHQLRRTWCKLRGAPIQIYRSEARQLRAQLVEMNARVLHVYFGHIGVYLLPLIEACPVPVIVSFHGADAMGGMEKPRHREAMKRMFSLAKLLLVRSESLAAKLVEAGCDRGKIRINRTGIPLDETPFTQREAPADGAWRCVQASRLIAKKGLATTVEAFAIFAKKYPLARLTFAGDGPMREQVWQRAITLGVQDRVDFAGFLSQGELRVLYKKSHLFLHPSELGPNGDQEGVPNSMLEGMAMGLPAIATRHGGIPEAIEDGVSGMLSAEKDHESIAANMLALAGDPARYAAMSRAASERVTKCFNLRVTAAALEGFYDEAAGAAHSP